MSTCRTPLVCCLKHTWCFSGFWTVWGLGMHAVNVSLLIQSAEVEPQVLKKDLHPTRYMPEHLIWALSGAMVIYPSYNTVLSWRWVIMLHQRGLLLETRFRTAVVQWKMRRMWMETEINELKKQTNQWDIQKGKRRGVGEVGMMRTTAVPLMWASLGPYVSLEKWGFPVLLRLLSHPPSLCFLRGLENTVCLQR